jgi:GT2 family glycosyltransferase
VCVPFYRHDPYLNRLVTAFLREPDPEIQLVVVNDGTPLEEAPTFCRLRDLLTPAGHVFHTQENAGVGAARNLAVELAAHDHILFCDADNVPHRGMVARLQDAMLASKADCVAAPFAAVPLMQRTPVEADVWFHFLPPGGSTVRGLVRNTLADAGSLIRRDVFNDVGGFTTARKSWEDWEFFLRFTLKGHRLRVYPEPICFYSHSPTGRNESAHNYHNHMNLFACLEQAPKERLAELLTVFVRDHLSRNAKL